MLSNCCDTVYIYITESYVMVMVMSGSIHRADAIASGKAVMDAATSGGGRRWGSACSPNTPLQEEQPTVEKTSRTTGLGTTMAMAGKLRIHQCLGCIACLLAHITNYKTSITVIKPTIPLLHLLHMTVCVCKR